MLARSLVALALLLSSAALAADEKKDDKKEEKKDAAPAATDEKKGEEPKKDDKKDAKKADDKKADDKKADDKKADGAEAPPLPPPADAPPTTPSEPTAPSGPLSAEDVEKLKAQIKAELEAELKAQMKNEMEAAARDAATQKAAAQEWEEEKWIEEVKPHLNFLEIDGYFRSRFDLFSRLDLNTYDPIAGRGTSGFPTPTMYRPFDGPDCNGTAANFPGDTCDDNKEDTQTMTSLNMRLRLDPTLNVSDDIRVRSTVDVFDNLVFGSTPESLPGFANNPSLPLPLFASSQNAPQANLNSLVDAIRIKRLWAEVATPIGQLRFGRMPQQFGLGLLANDGNKPNSDYGDNSDQIMFATRIAGHYIVPSYSLSSSGPVGRGGGAGLGGDANFSLYPGEQGQRINLDPKDDVHSFVLVVAKRDKEEDITEQLRNGNIVLNYGVFGVYRTQEFDIPSFYSKSGGQAATGNPIATPAEYVARKANAGIGSLWGRFQWEKLRIEAEWVGILAQVEGTSTSSNGPGSVDNALDVVEDGEIVHKPLWVMQTGAAVESSYKMLNDQLTFGLDFGFASGDDAFGFGLRPVINQAPKPGDFDGKQYGECLKRDAAKAVTRSDGSVVDCVEVDDNITNFRFDPDYQVDLILFKEIMGTVTDAIYLRPHVGYDLNESLGVRGDLVYSHPVFASSAPGVATFELFPGFELSQPLGLELDLSGHYSTDDGFFLMAQYGFLLPFGAFAHYADVEVADQFRNPQFAQTFKLYAGVMF